LRLQFFIAQLRLPGRSIMTEKPSYTYRTATETDIPGLAKLGLELFIETWAHLYSAEDLNDFLATVHTPHAVQADMETGRQYWIAQLGDEWVGYCKAGPVGVPVDTAGRRAAELKQLYIQRAHHGHGVADRLMGFFLDWAAERQIQDAYISCWSENFRALAFYRRYGFEECGRYLYKVGKQLDDERILKRVLIP
jgi:diamine N-acetyltransferase